MTGVLTQTWDPARLEAESRCARRGGAADERPRGCGPRDGAHNFTIQAMASALGPVYRGVALEEGSSLRSRGNFTVTLLVISPDYASHLLPLATLATAWRDAGERVVVAPDGDRPSCAGSAWSATTFRSAGEATPESSEPKISPTRSPDRCAGSSTPPGRAWCRPSAIRRASDSPT